MTEIEQQIADLDALIAANPTDADALYRRGSLKWKLGQQAAALSDFTASAHIDPNGPGATAAQGARNILDFYYVDLYNP